jgi:hypothetical protein
MKPNNFNWMVAQLAHLAWGAYLPFLFARVHFWHPFMLTLLFTGFKEALESLGCAPWEDKQTWFSSGIDFLFFVLGCSLTALLFGNIM